MPSLSHRSMTRAEFEEILLEGRVLEQDAHGPKLLLPGDGSMLKVYRCKRWWSKARFWPYCRRFANHAARLRALGIAAPEVLCLYRLRELDRTAVRYRPLPGQDLREVLRDYADDRERTAGLVEALGRFTARLHETGILFRAMHLGNVLLTDEGEFGLIDLADMTVGRRRLSCRNRLRAWHFMTRYRDDAVALHPYFEDFWRGYVALAGDRCDLKARFRSELTANLDAWRTA